MRPTKSFWTDLTQQFIVQVESLNYNTIIKMDNARCYSTKDIIKEK